MESFVALDLELTPFGGDQQRIIEIAAVRFRGGQVDDSFCTLVDPRCDLTPRVGALTGIRQTEVDAAPRLQEVAPTVVRFVGSDPVVGQSISLDLECLAAAGIRLANPILDTYELASILLPGLPSYDLGTIARALDVAVKQEHRALDDAMVAGRVLLALMDRAAALDPSILSQITQLASRIPNLPCSGFFREAQRRRVKEHFTRNGGAAGNSRGPDPSDMETDAAWGLFPGDSPRPEIRPAIMPSQQRIPVDPAELRALMAPGGAVASALPRFERREEQLRMMDAVAETLNEGGQLLVEAGTGTGKSMAYLLPAVYFAVRNGRRVVVSTNTINLQDQLYQKDIPALQACLPIEFRAALLKGRANYLCLRRWLVISRAPNLGVDEIMTIIKTLIWLACTRTGDWSELNLTAAQAEIWPRISAQAESCALSACPHFRRGACFVLRARRKAEGAHLVVVNHALLLSDLAISGGVLPEYGHLVIDEAHHLEEEATNQLGFTLSRLDLRSFLASLLQTTSSRRPAGFLPELQSALKRAAPPQGEIEALTASLAAAMRGVESCAEEVEGFFETLACFVSDHSEERSKFGYRLRVTDALRAQPGWSEIEVRWTELSQRLGSLRHHLEQLQFMMEAPELGELPEHEGIVAELAGFSHYLQRVESKGEEIVCTPGPNGIYWIGTGPSEADLCLCSAPLHVGEALNAALFKSKESVILTSATLATEGSFEYIKERLGLESPREMILGSPFDYRRSTLLYVVRDIPEPARPASQRAVEAVIADLVLALQGRTLVLFTSHAQLRATTSAIRSRLESAGILVLAHGVDGSRRRLLQAFMGSPRAVLMGTSSFWEGIDVVGERLSCLIIVKLPFSVPTDPIFAARSEAFEEPFRQYSVPQTILRLKQGFGRLIRSSTDRGVVVILDSRVGSKFYGPAFIHSLPTCTVRTGSAAHVVEAARSWLEAHDNSTGRA